MMEIIKKRTLYRNKYGQIKCDACGIYGDIVCPVHLRNNNGSWISWLCRRCNGPPGCHIDKVGDPIDYETYDGPIEIE